MTPAVEPVFLLGAGGFIGRQLAGQLAQQGRHVIAATRTPMQFAHPGIRNVVCPWDDAAQFAEWLPRCAAAIHAASSSTPGSSAARPQLDGNLRTTLAMIEALQDAPSCRVLFYSSGGTLYGERAAAATEADALLPRSYHGAGKAAAEHFFHAWATQYEGTVTILRPSNVFGPGQLPRPGFGIIPAAFDCARRGQPLRIWGEGSSVRDYLYIDDLLALSTAAIDASQPPGVHVYNAASGQAVRLEHLLDKIEAITGRGLDRTHAEARRVDVHSIVADATAARASFGWTPRVSLDTGLERTWQWFTRQA
jgi:UDP-glucose 4-epimerase